MVGVFNPFTFKVIIDIYVLIGIFIYCSEFIFENLFLLLCFLPIEVPLIFVVELI